MVHPVFIFPQVGLGVTMELIKSKIIFFKGLHFICAKSRGVLLICRVWTTSAKNLLKHHFILLKATV